MKGLLLVVSGPSGVGKGTLLGLLLSKRQDCVFSISATTRPARPGEIEGKHYYFLDDATFERWIEEDRFLEWQRVFDRFYGTPREFIERRRDEGKHVILDVDVQGGLELIERQREAVSVFIIPPDLDTLRQRLEQRASETPDQLRSRLLTARSELKYLHHYRYAIVNDELTEACSRLEAIIKAEMSRTDRQRECGALPAFVQDGT